MRFADSSRTVLDYFMRHFNALPQNFRDCLLAIKPKFTLKDKSDFPVLEISDDESDNGSITADQTTTTPRAKRRSTATTTTPSKRARVDASTNGTAQSTSNGRIKSEEQNGLTSRGGVAAPPRAQKDPLPEPFTQFTNVGKGFRTLHALRRDLTRKKTSGMPGLTSDEVYKDLAIESVEPWKGPMNAFISQTMHDLLQELERALNESLENLKKRSIYKEAKKHLRSCLQKHREEIEHDLDLLYKDERGRLLTFNDEALKQYNDEELLELTRFRHYMRLKAVGPDPGKYVPGSQLTEEKRVQDAKKREAELAKLGRDPFAPEIEVVAYVRGYYRLAALRFADAVSQRVICRMIPSIREELPSYLAENLGIRGPDAANVYVRLMEEDNATASRRETLKIEKEKLEKALASIVVLETASARNVSDLSISENETEVATQGVELPIVVGNGSAGVEDDEV